VRVTRACCASVSACVPSVESLPRKDGTLVAVVRWLATAVERSLGLVLHGVRVLSASAVTASAGRSVEREHSSEARSAAEGSRLRDTRFTDKPCLRHPCAPAAELLPVPAFVPTWEEARCTRSLRSLVTLAWLSTGVAAEVGGWTAGGDVGAQAGSTAECCTVQRGEGEHERTAAGARDCDDTVGARCRDRVAGGGDDGRAMRSR
jgi:hypothetical protein